jgi:GNAT superfamily N-acetyltransferase
MMDNIDKMQNIKIIKAISIDSVIEVFEGREMTEHKKAFIRSRISAQQVLLALNEDVPLGFLIYDFWWGDTPFIELLKVKKDFRKSGIGTQLMNQAIQEIRGEGFKTLISSSQLSNDMGKSFHRKQGFRDLNILDLPEGAEQYFALDLDKQVMAQ